MSTNTCTFLLDSKSLETSTPSTVISSLTSPAAESVCVRVHVLIMMDVLRDSLQSSCLPFMAPHRWASSSLCCFLSMTVVGCTA